MDLEKICTRLNYRVYNTEHEVFQDIQLTFLNGIKFNIAEPARSHVADAAGKMLTSFEHLWAFSNEASFLRQLKVAEDGTRKCIVDRAKESLQLEAAECGRLDAENKLAEETRKRKKAEAALGEERERAKAVTRIAYTRAFNSK